MIHKAFDIKKMPIFKSMCLLYKKENEYESIPVSCFKRKLSMNVENDIADFGYLNVSSHVVCF